MKQDTIITTPASANGALDYLRKRGALHKLETPTLVLGRNVVLYRPLSQLVKTP